MRYNFCLSYRKGSGKWKSSKNIYIYKNGICLKLQYMWWEMTHFFPYFSLYCSFAHEVNSLNTNSQDIQWNCEYNKIYAQTKLTIQQYKQNFIIELNWGFMLLLEFKSFDSIEILSFWNLFETYRLSSYQLILFSCWNKL